jgi:lysophospholipase L1-like esterase
LLFCAFLWPTKFDVFAKDAAVVRGSPDPAQTPDRRSPPAKKPTATGPARYDPEIAAFEKWDRQNAVPRDAILFVGSSSIRLWQTAEAFPDLPVINRGFGGSTVPDVSHFADRIVFKYKPRLIVFMCGDNDLAIGHSPEQVHRDTEDFRKMVHDGLPHARIIYLAIKPSPKRWQLWPKQQKVNALEKAISEKVGYFIYVDTATPVLGPDGQPQKDIFRDDSLHLNANGYKIWNKLLAPYLSPSPSQPPTPPPSGRGPG